MSDGQYSTEREREEREKEREKRERKTQIDRVLLKGDYARYLGLLCLHGVRALEKCLGIDPPFFDTEMEHNEEKCQMLAFYFRRETVFCEDIRLSVTLLLRQRHLSVREMLNGQLPLSGRNQPSLRKNHQRLGPPPPTQKHHSMKRNHREFGPPFLTERQSSVRETLGH